MKTRKFQSIDLNTSVLGFGCMRLPKSGPGDADIDRPRATAMIRSAIDAGVNYIDTAYGYHGGESERAVAEALADGYRDKVILATKLPPWHVKTADDMPRLLDEQLQKLKTDHIDFYLLHAIGGEAFDNLMKFNVLDFLEKSVKAGKIRFPSFSFHDDAAAFRRIVDAYDWKMAQVQLNLMDEFNQATLEGIKYAAGKGINIIAMEPLRGGALAATPPDNVKALYDAAPTRRTPVEWAMRYLYDMPEIQVVLSGMSTEEQVADNLRIFSGDCEPGCMNEAEKALIAKVRDAYLSRVKVGCTGCKYCMPCPAGVDIPGNFGEYDNCAMFNTPERFREHTVRWLAGSGRQAAKCVQCGECVPKCPQKIDIPGWMEKLTAEVGAV